MKRKWQMQTTNGVDEKERVQRPSRNEKTSAILVRNIPESATKDLLEVFFESKKKYGGGPVKDIQLMNDTKSAIVEFCDPNAAKEVLKKKPIKLGTAELDVEPFKPLISSSEVIAEADVKGTIKLPSEFTEELLTKHLGGVEPQQMLPYGPELTAMMKPGCRVVRGKDWCHGDEDGGGVGTVLSDPDWDLSKGRVRVKWDNGTRGLYRVGKDGLFKLKLAP